MKYRGVDLHDLLVESIFWPESRVAYIRARSSRRRGDVDIEPEWASQAAFEPRRIFAALSRPDGRESRSLTVVGRSDLAGFIVVVWLIPIELRTGEWIGVNAAKAGRRWVRAYDGTG